MKTVQTPIKTLVTARFPHGFRDELKALAGEDVRYMGRSITGYILSPDEIVENLKGTPLYISDVEQIDGSLMDRCPDLRVIACCRNEAFASVDMEAATKRGIPVVSAVGRNAVSVAEYTIALLMALCKNISQLDYLMRHTQEFTVVPPKNDADAKKAPPSLWSADPSGPAARFGAYPELYRKKFGQIGFGTIGREVAKRAAAFDMELLVSDPFADEEAIKAFNGRLVSLPELMAEADFISVNCNVTQATTNMLNREMLSLMKADAYLVNTARAPIMDYDALYELLEAKKIAGAALDVYPVEPVPNNSPFLQLDNVVLTPHMAGQARDIPFHQNRIILDNLKMLLAGERPKTICNPDVLPTFFAENENLLILK